MGVVFQLAEEMEDRTTAAPPDDAESWTKVCCLLAGGATLLRALQEQIDETPPVKRVDVWTSQVQFCYCGRFILAASDPDGGLKWAAWHNHTRERCPR